MLKTDFRHGYVWVSPDGEYYNGDAHENRAVEILEEIYGITDDDYDYASDKLEELGWIRLTSSLLWDYRIEDGYFRDRDITQKQLDALSDWCRYHNKKMPVENDKDEVDEPCR